MNNEQHMVQEFHRKFNRPVGAFPRMLSSSESLLRMRLIVEEASECLAAASKNDIISLVDGLCDLLYVTYGTAVTMGIDLEPIFAEVHRSNMTKQIGKLDCDGKVVHGDEFEPPDIEGKLEEQGLHDV